MPTSTPPPTDTPMAGAQAVILPDLDESAEHPLETGWRVYPFPPIFWRRTTVQALNPHLCYFGPLPQFNSFTEQIVRLYNFPAFVYVIQADDGDVLYVGKTVNPVGRLASHRAKKDWWPQFGLLTMLGIEAESRVEADGVSLKIESIAIRDCEPRYNIAGVRR